MNGSLWLAWNADVTAMVGIPLAAVLYARGLRTLGPRRPLHAWWRPVAFYAGLAVVFAALVSPLDALSSELFVAHMGQHMLLIFVAVPAIQLGAPVLPILRGIPRPVRRGVVAPALRHRVVRGALRFFFRPLIAWPLFTATLALWHYPFAYEAALNNEAVHVVEHLAFAAGAYVWWWNVIDPMPLRSSLSYLARVPFVFITIVPAFVLGAFLAFSPEPWYPSYEATAPAYGLTALEDQQIGGLVMWVPGSFVLAATLLLTLAYAVRSEQQAQLKRERQELGA